MERPPWWSAWEGRWCAHGNYRVHDRCRDHDHHRDPDPGSIISCPDQGSRTSTLTNIMAATMTLPGLGLQPCGRLMLPIRHKARLIALNMTTNEMMNIHRYRHFWVMGRFNNPFHKGGVVKNCLDFWWTRRRAQDGSPPACHVHKACCQN